MDPAKSWDYVLRVYLPKEKTVLGGKPKLAQPDKRQQALQGDAAERALYITTQ
jgi:hypothetical protein